MDIYDIKNKHDAYRGKDCMRTFCKSSREYVTKITNFEKKNMIPLINEQQELYEKNKNLLHLQKKSLNIYTLMITVVVKLKIIFIIQINIEVVYIA